MGSGISLAAGAEPEWCPSLQCFGKLARMPSKRQFVALVSVVFVTGCGDRPTGNRVPITAADDATTAEDEPVELTVLANDADPEGGLLTVVEVTSAGHGSVTIGDSAVTYSPEPDFFGTDSFTYTATDPEGLEASALVTVHVNAVNDAPTGVADVGFTDEDAEIEIDVLANDVDVEGDALSVGTIVSSSNGTSSFSAAGGLIFTPAPDFYGQAWATYSVIDGNGGLSQANVSITVSSINDAPVSIPDHAITLEDVPVAIDVLANDTDVDGDVLTISGITGSTNGTASVNGPMLLFTPDPEYSGPAALTYEATDSNGGYSTATAAITVMSSNDPPTAAGDAYVVGEDSPLIVDSAAGVLANDSDIDSASIVAIAASSPARGTLSLQTDGSFSYTPDPDFHGNDQFSYRASDGSAESGDVPVQITVSRMEPPTEISKSHGEMEQVTLWWTGAPGATGYNVYFASDPSVSPSNYATLPDGRVKSFTASPASILDVHTKTYFVVTAVDASGESAGSATIEATPNRRQFASPQQIDPLNPGALQQWRVAMDEGGNALSIWLRNEGGSLVLRSAYYTSNGSWSASSIIQGHGPLPGVQSVGFLGTSGIAVWTASDGVQRHGYESRFTPGVGWDAPRIVATDPSHDVAALRFATDARRNHAGIASLAGGRMTASILQPNGDWGPPYVLSTSTAGHPLIAMDAIGGAMFGWTERDGLQDHLFVQRLDPESGLRPSTLVTTANRNGLGINDGIGLAINQDASAGAMAWTEHDGTRPSVWASTWSPDTGWTVPELLETTDGWAERTTIAVDDYGNAIVVWSQEGPTGWYRVYANRRPAGGAWGSAEVVGDCTIFGGSTTFGPVHCRYPAMDVTPGGTATVAWFAQASPSYTPERSVMFNRYFIDGGWQSQNFIASPKSGSFVQIDTTSFGAAFVIFTSDDAGIESLDSARAR